MKINPSFLLKMLAPMQVVIPKRHPLNICTCLKLDSQGFTGTDLQNTVYIPYKNLPNVCIDYREFVDTLKTLGNRIVEMQVNSETYEITFTTGEMTMKLVGESPDDYPLVPEFITGFKTTLPVLKDFTPFASTDEHKPAMNGIFVGKDICSTDAHRLKWEPNPYFKEGNPEIVVNLIVAQKFCTEIRTVEISESQELARIHLDFGFVITRLINDKYPEYANVIPALSETFAKVEKQALISSLQACDKYANKITHLVRLTFTADKLCIVAEDISYNKEFNTTIPCVFNGEPGFEIGFSAKFLIEVLKDCQGEFVELFLIAPTKVCRINSNMLIMPTEIKQPETAE